VYTDQKAVIAIFTLHTIISVTERKRQDDFLKCRTDEGGTKYIFSHRI